ncbi:SRPBCC family protein [Noviherbaspirillum sp. ST9]|uniref:SRPBCC family protein n=1 Tax=Noviherbaspirillum sp. ST9 TaxID=3401606 RepID=UPI003B586662
MEYRLLTLWKIAAPRRQVYDAVFDSLRWPAWWPAVEHVEQIASGDADGIGDLRRYIWKGRLPYCLSFVARATAIEECHLLAAEVDGDLTGSGRWTFLYDSGITTVRYDWQVRTTRLWMNALAPLARGIFARNHHAVMRQGGEALARHLETRLVNAYYGDLP